MSVFAPAAERRDGLRTDLYQLTMIAAMHQSGVEHEATFELFNRRLRADRGFYVAAGLEQALEYLEGLRFTPDQVEHLRRLPEFERVGDDFFTALADLRFSGEVWALPEGTPFFPGEPLLRVTAPALEAQVVETYLLAVVNFESLIATKAARIKAACGGKPFADFGTRRAHGPEAGELAARAAFVGGATSTSNVEAGFRLGLPVVGTFAHSWVMQHDDEDEAFRRYARVFPGHTTLLIDTYDTVAAARRIVAEEIPCDAVRLDSGDLRELSLAVRQVLDEGGRPEVEIVASSDLNEYAIAAMERAGCAIDLYGVGTDLVTSRDLPAFGGVYKVVHTRGSDGVERFPMKLSADKKSWPDRKQVYRLEEAGTARRDVLARAGEEPPPGARPLLERVMVDGRRTAPSPALAEVQARCLEEVARLPAGVRRLEDPDEYPVERSEALVALREEQARRLRERLGRKGDPS